MTAFEMWVIGGLLSAIVLLIGLNWNQLSKRIENHEQSTIVKFKDQMDHIGKHYSEINDLKVDQRELRTHINNHIDRFDELTRAISSLHDLLREGMQNIHDKLDSWRERRQ